MEVRGRDPKKNPVFGFQNPAFFPRRLRRRVHIFRDVQVFDIFCGFGPPADTPVGDLRFLCERTWTCDNKGQLSVLIASKPLLGEQK